MAAQNPPLPPNVYAVFAGPIDQAAIQRIFNGFTTASASGVKSVHLLFQSTGGGIGEGVALYNFFKSLNFDLTLYNAGTIASIAVIAYLGAKHRKTSAHATFMIHRTQTTTQYANTETIKTLAEAAIINDKRTEAILREHINMPDDKWNDFDHNDLTFSAEDAVRFGIAEEISDFAPPPGTRLFNV